ncbi:MAG: radical SAM protein [Deltaproteobacteria bacterium]|nr:MAG: radical SAM protein [Deltaproteobacteria bacterium]
MNGQQLYGPRRLMATLKMGLHKELRGLTIKQKLALNYVSKESKLTRLNGKIYSNTFTPAYPSPAYDRFLKGVVSTASGISKPVIVNFAITPQCPCNCWHCSFADRAKKDVLSLAYLKESIASVQGMGTSVIGLTGGEPLLRKDLEDVIACIDQRSMSLLFTTGYRLTRERVQRLKQAGLGIPIVSLDHYSAQRHDKGRRKEGMHACAVKAIELFKEAGFYVAISFVPDRDLVDNREELFKTIDFFRDLGVNDMRLTSPILSGHLTRTPDALLSPKHVQTIFEIQKMCTATPGYPGVFAYDYFESRQYYGCGAGYNYMFIDSQGNVSPCDFAMISFGNILKEAVEDIWQTMSEQFQVPGCGCYANRISSRMASRKPDHWPLDPITSKEIIDEVPPFDIQQIPEFYKRMGLGS